MFDWLPLLTNAPLPISIVAVVAIAVLPVAGFFRMLNRDYSYDRAIAAFLTVLSIALILLGLPITALITGYPMIEIVVAFSYIILGALGLVFVGIVLFFVVGVFTHIGY